MTLIIFYIHDDVTEWAATCVLCMISLGQSGTLSWPTDAAM